MADFIPDWESVNGYLLGQNVVWDDYIWISLKGSLENLNTGNQPDLTTGVWWSLVSGQSAIGAIVPGNGISIGTKDPTKPILSTNVAAGNNITISYTPSEVLVINSTATYDPSGYTPYPPYPPYPNYPTTTLSATANIQTSGGGTNNVVLQRGGAAPIRFFQFPLLNVLGGTINPGTSLVWDSGQSAFWNTFANTYPVIRMNLQIGCGNQVLNDGPQFEIKYYTEAFSSGNYQFTSTVVSAMNPNAPIVATAGGSSRANCITMTLIRNTHYDGNTNQFQVKLDCSEQFFWNSWILPPNPSQVAYLSVLGSF